MNRPSRSTTRASSKSRKSPTRYSSIRKSPRKRSPGRSPSVNRQSTRTQKFAKISLPRIEIPRGKYIVTNNLLFFNNIIK